MHFDQKNERKRSGFPVPADALHLLYAFIGLSIVSAFIALLLFIANSRP